jgi:hypothetical protein
VPTSRVGRFALALTVVLAVTAHIGRLVAEAQQAPAPIFRLFLRDGSSLASYGEFARVGDRVVFSSPLGEADGLLRLQAVSVPADDVDWPETERYSASLRAERYFATRASVDFEDLAETVQKHLEELARTDDAQMKLAIAERMRNTLAAWPAEHHGYRTDEVRQMLALADDVVSELQAPKGVQQFSLALVAIPEAPPRAPLLPAPTLQESIEQVLRLTGLAPSPAERILLLEAARKVLEEERLELPGPWRDRTLRNVVRTIEVEQKTTRNYARLRDRAVAHLGRLASGGDVRGIERLIEDVRRRDQRMGQQRPDMIAALLSTLDGRLGVVRRDREAKERAAVLRKALGEYVRAVEKPLDESSKAIADLTEIRAGNFLPTSRSADLTRRLARMATVLGSIKVPPDAAATHAAFTSAVTLARHAVAMRNTPGANPVQTLRDASAAAAGALMLLERVRIDTGVLAGRPGDRSFRP